MKRKNIIIVIFVIIIVLILIGILSYFSFQNPNHKKASKDPEKIVVEEIHTELMDDKEIADLNLSPRTLIDRCITKFAKGEQDTLSFPYNGKTISLKHLTCTEKVNDGSQVIYQYKDVYKATFDFITGNVHSYYEEEKSHLSKDGNFHLYTSDFTKENFLEISEPKEDYSTQIMHYYYAKDIGNGVLFRFHIESEIWLDMGYIDEIISSIQIS